MNQQKITSAVARLENNLPIRHEQARLPQPLRRLHQSILRYFLENGHAPGAGDIEHETDWHSGVRQLAGAHIIVADETGKITGAYPFVDEEREFRVVTRFGAVYAMCAFDALAVSSMFGETVRIESRCRVSGSAIVIEQQGADIRVVEPADTVYAAIDWNAAAGASSCSATLCTEMIFLAGEARARQWRDAAPAERELFALDEAHAFISAVFVPLMSAEPAESLAG